MSVNLALDTVAPTQTGKTSRINDIFAEVDAAITELLVITASSTPVTVVALDFERHWLFRLTGTVASCVVNFPATKRMFAVQNTGSNSASISVGTTSITLASAANAMYYTDGTANGLVQMGGGSGGSTTLASLTDVSITGTPTTGYVLKYNGSQWAPAVDATGSGGGGGTDADLSIGAASTYTVLPTSSVTLTDRTSKGLSISAAYNAAGGAAVKAVASGGWTGVHTKVRSFNQYGQYGYTGVALHYSSTNKQVFFGLVGQANNALPQVAVIHLNNWIFDNRPYNQGACLGHEWFRIHKNGSNYDFQIGSGDDWGTVYSESTTAYIGTPTHYGMLMFPAASGLVTAGTESALFVNFTEEP